MYYGRQFWQIDTYCARFLCAWTVHKLYVIICSVDLSARITILFVCFSSFSLAHLLAHHSCACRLFIFIALRVYLYIFCLYYFYFGCHSYLFIVLLVYILAVLWCIFSFIFDLKMPYERRSTTFCRFLAALTVHLFTIQSFGLLFLKYVIQKKPSLLRTIKSKQQEYFVSTVITSVRVIPRLPLTFVLWPRLY